MCTVMQEKAVYEVTIILVKVECQFSESGNDSSWGYYYRISIT